MRQTLKKVVSYFPKHLVPGLLRRHPLSGVTLLLATSLMLFLVIELTLNRQPPVFILFGEEDLNPNASLLSQQLKLASAYNVEEILTLED